jgi:poly(3-hydroxybutyrate) depolymerase
MGAVVGCGTPSTASVIEDTQSWGFWRLPYRVVIPQGTVGKRPLFVLLHGCVEDNEGHAERTRFDALARRDGFFAAYPQQSIMRNGMRCWDWFWPQNNMRDHGEAEEIVGMVKHLVATQPIDPERVYVAGLSAGGVMAANLLSCYPDVFRAAAVHSGLPFRALPSWKAPPYLIRHESPLTGLELAHDTAECRRDIYRLPVRPWLGRGQVLSIIGSADSLIHWSYARQAAEQVALTTQFENTGRWDRPLKRSAHGVSVPKGMKHYKLETLEPVGGPPSYFINVAGMEHAWSGGPSDMLFSDATGPDASELITRFFLQGSLE